MGKLVFDDGTFSEEMHCIKLQLQEAIQLANEVLSRINELCCSASVVEETLNNSKKKQKEDTNAAI